MKVIAITRLILPTGTNKIWQFKKHVTKKRYIKKSHSFQVALGKGEANLPAPDKQE